MLEIGSSMQAATCTPQVLAETALKKTVEPEGVFWIAKPFVRMSFVNSSVAFFFQNGVTCYL
jgi:hypothetical protein